jgi:hypothetical protein
MSNKEIYPGFHKESNYLGTDIEVGDIIQFRYDDSQCLVLSVADADKSKFTPGTKEYIVKHLNGCSKDDVRLLYSFSCYKKVGHI